MKTKIIITLASFLLPFYTIYSQVASPISKGSKVIGVSLDLSSATKSLYESNDGDKLFRMDGSVGFAYFFTDHVVAGTSLRVISSKYTTKTRKIGLESHLAYYLGKTEREKIPGSVYPFAELALNYFGETVTDADDNKTKANILSYGPAAGVTIMLSNSVALSGRLGYIWDRKKIKDTGEVLKGTWFSPQMSIVFFLYDKGNSMF